MRLSVTRGGGLAGAVTRAELDSDVLSSEDARTLRDKVKEAGLLEHDDSPPSPPSHPDDLAYEVTIEDEGVRRTTRVHESAMSDAVRSLIAWSDSRPERRMRVDRG